MKKSKMVVTIVAAIIIIVGVFAMVYNFVIVYNSDLKYLTYKSINATVSTVQSAYVDGDSFYKATYSFSINGTGYSCDSGFTTDQNKFIENPTATVRYDPKNPSNCYLVTESRTWNYLYLGISCIFLIFGIKLFDKQLRTR